MMSFFVSFISLLSNTFEFNYDHRDKFKIYDNKILIWLYNLNKLWHKYLKLFFYFKK